MTPPNRPADPPARPGRRRALATMILAGWGLLPGCGGGDPVPAVAPAAARRRPLGGVDSGGTGKTFFRSGVQRVAPLAAEGVSFDTAGASFSDADGQAFDPATLAPGMTVEIEAGSVTEVDGQPQATARAVRRSEQLAGALQSLQPATGTLQVWSQTVLVTTATLVDPALAADWSLLVPGTPLRVWGQLDTVRRRVVATRIDRPDPGAPQVVRGVLTLLDRDAGLVGVGALRAAAAPGQPVTLPDDVELGEVVRLVLAPGAGPVAVLLALRADPVALGDRERATIDGRIGTLESLQRFTVDGVPVEAEDAAFTGTPVPGARVSVTGVAEGGRIQATLVQVLADEIDEVAEVEGTIQAVDSSAARFVVRRTTVQWSEATVFEGGSAASLRPRRRVQAKGRRTAGRGVVQAFHVKVED